MPIVTHEYLMSLTVLSANTKCRTVADRADFVPGPHLQNGTEYELQSFTVTSSLRDVSEFVRIVRILEPYLTFAILRDNRYCATYGHLRYVIQKYMFIITLYPSFSVYLLYINIPPTHTHQLLSACPPINVTQGVCEVARDYQKRKNALRLR